MNLMPLGELVRPTNGLRNVKVLEPQDVFIDIFELLALEPI